MDYKPLSNPDDLKIPQPEGLVERVGTTEDPAAGGGNLLLEIGDLILLETDTGGTDNIILESN